MGCPPSKPAAPELNERLIERLRALELNSDKMFDQESQDSLESQISNDYVHVQVPPSGSKLTTLRHAERSPTLSVSVVEDWERELLGDSKNRLALAALSSNAPTSILTSRSTLIADQQTFNLQIPIQGSPITNQQASGRCWLFASTNVFRVALMRRHNLKDFQLSQAYLFFWDKLEKANFFLEQVLDTFDQPLDGRLMQTLLAMPVGDGGQWDMVTNLVEKYGLVPHDLYPDSFIATNSGVINPLITSKLREDALKLRRYAKHRAHGRTSAAACAFLAKTKQDMMREIHLILTLALGPPPPPDKEFTWEYYDAADKFHSKTITPLDFAKELSSSSGVRACGGTDVHRLFSLVNDPRNPYGELLSVSRLGNVVGGQGVRYVNVDMATIKRASIAMLRRGLPLFFGCDVGKSSSASAGIMDPTLYDYRLAFNTAVDMTKAERLRTGDSAMTHAMVITAVHLVPASSTSSSPSSSSSSPSSSPSSETTTEPLTPDNLRPLRWRVQNSWGPAAGSEGWFVMSDAWMDRFVYQVVVDPAFVPKSVKDVLGGEKRMLELWDPMGALA
ncbi:MAG: hypothetical protein M1817_000628 [Caeruleum heppii]|nr:MAG: hypothetical protein M1817_000628 [Caeruleum heppii]